MRKYIFGNFTDEPRFSPIAQLTVQTSVCPPRNTISLWCDLGQCWWPCNHPIYNCCQLDSSDFVLLRTVATANSCRTLMLHNYLLKGGVTVSN